MPSHFSSSSLSSSSLPFSPSFPPLSYLSSILSLTFLSSLSLLSSLSPLSLFSPLQTPQAFLLNYASTMRHWRCCHQRRPKQALKQYLSDQRGKENQRMEGGKLRKLPQVNSFWQTNGPPCGFSCKLLASFNAFNGFLDVPNPSISLLQEGCLEEVVLLFGCSDLQYKLKIKRYPIRNDPFQGPPWNIAVDMNLFQRRESPMPG